jgi:hypothetical protein
MTFKDAPLTFRDRYRGLQGGGVPVVNIVKRREAIPKRPGGVDDSVKLSSLDGVNVRVGGTRIRESPISSKAMAGDYLWVEVDGRCRPL